MDLSLTALRVLREVAELGSFTGAAMSLGYTQSAVSRQIAGLESAVRQPLFERRRDGVRLTEAGRTLLWHASIALDELDVADRTISGADRVATRVRLGAFASAGAVLVPTVVAALRNRSDVELHTRAGSTAALVHALRAGSCDLAVVASIPPFRPLDDESPALVTRVLVEDDLRVALADTHPLAADDAIDAAALEGQRWVASRAGGDETVLGVWPGLAGRPTVVHSNPDWLAKLNLVAAGAGVTTVPSLLLPALPRGVRARPVRGGPRERRRVLLARRPGARGPAVAAVAAALRDSARQIAAIR